MTPAARYGAAIEILDGLAKGGAAEQHLTRWARGARFAGSKDRAAVRDIVFDVLRRKESCAWLGGGTSGRTLVLGLLRGQDVDPNTVFTGHGYAPQPLEAAEIATPDPALMPQPAALDMPDWLLPAFEAQLGEQTPQVLAALRERAPIGIRTNLRRITSAELQARLAEKSVDLTPHPAADGAFTAPAGTRGLANTLAYQDGLFELQDPGSQGLVSRLPISENQRVLDYCSGGGGKALAMLARADLNLVAHDISTARMADLPKRAARAGVRLTIAEPDQIDGQFDGIVCDVPCSGSGAWRRAAQARWDLTPERFAELQVLQRDILSKCVGYLKPGGWLAYMTCSLFEAENATQSAWFLEHFPQFASETEWSTTPLEGTDGFYLHVFRAK